MPQYRHRHFTKDLLCEGGVEYVKFSNCTFAPGLTIRNAKWVHFSSCSEPYPQVEGVREVTYKYRAPSVIDHYGGDVVVKDVHFTATLSVLRSRVVFFERCTFDAELHVDENIDRVVFITCYSLPSRGTIPKVDLETLTQDQLEKWGVRELNCEYLSPQLTNLQQLERLEVCYFGETDEVESEEIPLLLTATSLSSLRLLSSISPEDMRRLSSLIRLEKISSYGFEYNSSKEESWLMAWKNHPNLFEVHWNFCQRDLKILQEMPQLTMINLDLSSSEPSKQIGRGHLQRLQRKTLFFFTLVATLYHS